MRVPLSLTDLINIEFALQRQIDRELSPSFHKIWKDTLDKIKIARTNYETSLKKQLDKYGPKEFEE